MKQQEVSEEFERFAAAHGRAVWEEVLKRRRDAEGNPNWRPNTLEGMCLSKPSSQNSLGKVLPVTASECGRPSLLRRIAHSRCHGANLKPTLIPIPFAAW